MSPLPTSLSMLSVVALLVMVDTIEAQCTPNSSRSSTHPAEARALSAMFSGWGIQPSNQDWNNSGDLCTGVAVDATEIQNINPGIKCDCSYSGSTICHITALRVHSLDIQGELPQELWNLTYLTHLNLSSNSLTGNIPPSIRYLKRLQHLSLGINQVSGELPAELGLLTDLRSLSFRINNFSGPLPSSLGNLSRLTDIYLDSSGVSGPIPATFANLRGLETVWASDNELSGHIPTFIGNWPNLTALRFQGNSFQGPIPTSFISLVSLNDLRISDLSNGSSSLDFLRNMKNLSTLILRNNNISGGIPSFYQFHSLTLLDLSFNRLSGSPNLLFFLTSLTYMFLGNNMLTGSLPAEKSPNLLNIDLSFNELNGRIPSWIGEPLLQINLVANNFVVDVDDSENISSRLFGLHCLQRKFPCSRGSPIYSSFAVNCGDPQPIISSNQVLYQNDPENLVPAGYHVTPTRRWAVSNAGLPSDTSEPQYLVASNRLSNNMDANLFRVARISAGSLRYYGLGLVNGNYTVTLLFPATEFMSRGRRVFDIYIQESLQVRDFVIRREPDGSFASTIVRNFTAQVRNNYLEIHLFWAGKGSSLPENGTYGPLVSAISVTPDFTPAVRNRPPRRKRNQTIVIFGIVVAVGVMILFLLAAIIYYVYYGRKRQENFGEEELRGMDARPYIYSYTVLKEATKDFDPANKLGEGGFGSVYKGTLKDGRRVAVKRLSVASNHGKSQFVAEIATISAVQHRNLVKLYGCCVEGENKCLCLSWSKRYDICLGVARGLAYLHEESRPRIVHRDVKASNILLDSDLTPKISDFGLAKLYDDNRSHISTRIAGTIGYLAPEYAMRGHLTEKADIFSFGVVALEMISGRPNSDISLEEDKIYLLEWAWNLHENNRQIELVDKNLHRFDEDAVKRIIGTGLLCTQASPGLRPSMSRVVAMLSGDIEVPSVTSKPGYLTDLNFTDATTFASYLDSTVSDGDVNLCSNSTMDPQFLPVDATIPMLAEIIGSSTDDHS